MAVGALEALDDIGVAGVFQSGLEAVTRPATMGSR
jgi:hypothetical protein